MELKAMVVDGGGEEEEEPSTPVEKEFEYTAARPSPSPGSSLRRAAVAGGLSCLFASPSTAPQLDPAAAEVDSVAAELESAAEHLQSPAAEHLQSAALGERGGGQRPTTTRPSPRRSAGGSRARRRRGGRRWRGPVPTSGSLLAAEIWGRRMRARRDAGGWALPPSARREPAGTRESGRESLRNACCCWRSRFLPSLQSTVHTMQIVFCLSNLQSVVGVSLSLKRGGTVEGRWEV
ncbi:unnamed protein product [Urochloa humidicola]